MRKAWDPQQPVETLFKQIQDCVDFAEAGGVAIGAAQKLSSAYSKIFKSGKFNSACRRWDEKLEGDKTWNSFKIHFAAAYRYHRQMQGETIGAQAFTNYAATQASEDDLTEQALGAFANLTTATSVDRNVVAQLTEDNSRLAKQLEDNSTSLKEVKAILKKNVPNTPAVGTPIAPLVDHSPPPAITIAGHMEPRLHVLTQAKLVCILRRDTNVKQPR
jgi:hypothetical protein